MLFIELLFLRHRSSNENSYCCNFFFLPLTCWLYYSKIWQLSLPRLHTLTISHLPQSKTCLQIHYIDVIKKGIPRWSNLKVVRAEIIFFRSTWYTAPLSWHLVSTSMILTSHPIRTFWFSSVPHAIKIWKCFRFRGSENAEYRFHSLPEENWKGSASTTVKKHFSFWKCTE